MMIGIMINVEFPDDTGFEPPMTDYGHYHSSTCVEPLPIPMSRHSLIKSSSVAVLVLIGCQFVTAQETPFVSEYVSTDSDTAFESTDGDSNCVSYGGILTQDSSVRGAGCCCAHDFCRSRPTLTGDWLGHRSTLQDSGVTFRGTVTQFAFGVAGGINNPAVPAPFGQGDTFEYTGRGEYDLIFDLEQLCGMPKGKLLVGAQHWWGQFGNVSFNTGAFIPAVLPAIMPPTPNEPG